MSNILLFYKLIDDINIIIITIKIVKYYVNFVFKVFIKYISKNSKIVKIQ